MASEAVTPPPSTLVRTSSTASSAPGIFRSASWARIRSRREPAAFTELTSVPPGHTLPVVGRRSTLDTGKYSLGLLRPLRAAVPRLRFDQMGARPRAGQTGLARARTRRSCGPLLQGAMRTDVGHVIKEPGERADPLRSSSDVKLRP